MHLRAPRNAPCPCGSGRKYKNCCYRIDASNDRSEERLLAAKDSVLNALTKYALRRTFLNAMHEALNEYGALGKAHALGGVVEFLFTDEGEFFLDWFIYDYIMPNGKTVLEAFMQDPSIRLRPVERELVGSWLNQPFTLLQVTQIIPDWGIEGHDLLFERTLRIRDVALSHSAEQWMLLNVRLLPLGSMHIISNPPTALPPMQKKRLLKAIEELIDDYRAEHPFATLNDALKARGYKIYEFMNESPFEHLPMMVNSENDPMEFVFGLFTVDDPHKLIAVLDAAPEFERNDEESDVADAQGGLPTVRYTMWSDKPSDVSETDQEQKPTSAFADPDGRLMQGSLRLVGSQLLFTGNSRARLQRAINLLQKISGSAVRLEQQVAFSPLEAMQSGGIEKLLEPYPAIAALCAHEKTMAEIDPEVAKQAEQQFMEQYYARWINEPLPALDGLTPKQAAAREEYHEKLEDILRDIEYTERQKQAEGRYGLDVQKLRRELGL